MKYWLQWNWQLLLVAVGELNIDFDPRILPERAPAAVKVTQADSIVFTRFSYGRKFDGITWNNSEPLVPEMLHMFAWFMYVNPLVNDYPVEKRRETLKNQPEKPGKGASRFTGIIILIWSIALLLSTFSS